MQSSAEEVHWTSSTRPLWIICAEDSYWNRIGPVGCNADSNSKVEESLEEVELAPTTIREIYSMSMEQNNCYTFKPFVRVIAIERGHLWNYLTISDCRKPIFVRKFIK